MFSPTHTPPPESSSEDEDDINLPMVDLGTPKKPKLENESQAQQTQATEPRVSHTAACPPSGSVISCTTHCTGSSSISTDASVAAASSTAVLSSIQADIKFNYKRRLEVAKKEYQLMADGMKNSSPIKVESLKATNESKRTAKKVKKLSKSLQEKTEMERTLEELRSLKGIQGIAKLEEEKSLALDHESHTPLSNGSSLSSLSHQHGSRSSDQGGLLSPSLPSNPGKAMFVHKPSLITELYPPGIEVQDGGLLGDALIHSGVEDLKTIVCNQTLPLAYITRPCPTELIQWLFQLMACSDDHRISTGALKSLTGLLQNAKKLENCSFSVPSVPEIVDVLVTLGAERGKLRPPLTGSGTRVKLMALEREEEADVSPPALLHINLCNLLNYISLCVHAVADYTVQHLEELALILASLSLDRTHALSLRRSLQLCMHRILDAYPEKVWAKAVKRLSPQLACLSPHHHDRVLLAKLVCGVRLREKFLLRDFCRWCLLQMVNLSNSQPEGKGCVTAKSDSRRDTTAEGSGHCASSISDKRASLCSNDKHNENPAENSCKATQTKNTASLQIETSDCVFLTRVLTLYHRALPKQMTDGDYYEIHSLLYMLQLYAPLSDLTFPSKSSKQEFLSLLGTVRGSVREDPMRPITSVVKDLLIRMKLELESKSSGSSQEKLTDIFSFSS